MAETPNVPRNMDLSACNAATIREAGKRCPGGGEAHDAHLNINGECPWCGCYDSSRW